MICQQVPPALMDEIWPRVGDWIEAALSKGDRWWMLDGLRREIETNPDCGLFLAMDRQGIYGAAVVMVETKPNGERVAHFPALGGRDLKRWLHLVSDLKGWAKGRGASRLMIHGRPGWVRVLKGYRQAAVTLETGL